MCRSAYRISALQTVDCITVCCTPWVRSAERPLRGEPMIEVHRARVAHPKMADTGTGAGDASVSLYLGAVAPGFDATCGAAAPESRLPADHAWPAGRTPGRAARRNEWALRVLRVHQRRPARALRGLAAGPHAEVAAEVVLDARRAWCARVGMTGSPLPQARVIACVRHVPRTIDHIERLVQRNAFQPSPIFNFSLGGAVSGRAKRLADGVGMVDCAYRAQREAISASTRITNCCGSTGRLSAIPRPHWPLFTPSRGRRRSTMTSSLSDTTRVRLAGRRVRRGCMPYDRVLMPSNAGRCGPLMTLATSRVTHSGAVRSSTYVVSGSSDPCECGRGVAASPIHC